jgi:hypothetical protein
VIKAAILAKPTALQALLRIAGRQPMRAVECNATEDG